MKKLCAKWSGTFSVTLFGCAGIIFNLCLTTYIFNLSDHLHKPLLLNVEHILNICTILFRISIGASPFLTNNSKCNRCLRDSKSIFEPDFATHERPLGTATHETSPRDPAVLVAPHLFSMYSSRINHKAVASNRIPFSMCVVV